MEFKKLQEVNSRLGTIDIKGKAYVEVNKRILAFRELYPNGKIINEIISNENGIVIFKSTIIGDSEILAVAHAYEKDGSGFINKTSYIENCETSAVGRALGMCGIGVDASVASFEEVSNAIKQQSKEEFDTSERASDLNIKNIKIMLEETQTDVKKFLAYYKVKSVDELSVKDYNTAVKQLEKKKNAETDKKTTASNKQKLSELV